MEPPDLKLMPWSLRMVITRIHVVHRSEERPSQNGHHLSLKLCSMLARLPACLPACLPAQVKGGCFLPVKMAQKTGVAGVSRGGFRTIEFSRIFFRAMRACTTRTRACTTHTHTCTTRIHICITHTHTCMLACIFAAGGNWDNPSCLHPALSLRWLSLAFIVHCHRSPSIANVQAHDLPYRGGTMECPQ